MTISAFLRLFRVGKTYWREILAIFLLLVGIYFFRVEHKELAALATHLHAADSFWIAVGVGVTVLYLLFQAAMYVYSYAAIGAKLTWRIAWELFLKRNFLSVFLPAGGISSLAYAPSALRKRGLSKVQTHQASAIYAFVGLLTVFMIGVPLVIYALLKSQHFKGVAEGLFVVFVALILFVGLFKTFQHKGRLYQFCNKRFPAWMERMDQVFRINVSSRAFWLVVAYSLAVEVCGIVHIFIAAKAYGLPISLEASAIAYTITVVMMIVSPFLRGLGAVEFSMVYILGVFGIEPLNALALTILYRCFEFWLPLLAGFTAFIWKGRHILARLFPAFMVFALGVINILSVITPPMASRLRLLKAFIPAESINESNLLVLLIGLVLLVVSAFLLKGHRSAWGIALFFSLFSLVGHLFKALDYEEAVLAATVVLVLLLSFKQYKLRSNQRRIHLGLGAVALVFVAVLLFGGIGFYYSEKRDFGSSFTWWQSLQLSAKSFLLLSDSSLHPVTTLGKEYLRLINSLGFLAWCFLACVLLVPLLEKQNPARGALARANELLRIYGNSAVDYFKVHPDKQLFFSQQVEAFVAYRVARGFAIVLEDPVCAVADKTSVLKEFDRYCHRRGLKTAYYRVDESKVAWFSALNKHKMFIGQEAILEVEVFTLEGRDKKSLRNGLNSLQKKGYHTQVYKAPHNTTLLQELKEVSDEWLQYNKRREIGFSQGIFDMDELKGHDLIVIRNESGSVKAFLNIIPDFTPSGCTYDLIRKTTDAPGGCMDALIIHLIEYAREKGLKYINLGLVPLTGMPQPNTAAEQIVYYASEKLKHFRHYLGLRAFKEKYASIWRNKYLIYENDFDLLQLPLALNKVMKPTKRKRSLK